jgi:VPDSG-CTERM motif
MKNLFKVIIAVAAISCVASIYAVPTLTLFDGTTTVVVTDGETSPQVDRCPDAGCVTFIGAIGVWNINVDTGLTKPASGSATMPDMDLNYIARATAAGSLKISWSDSGFTFSGVASDIFGGTQQAGTGTSTLDQIFINGVLVFQQGPFTTSSFSQTSNGFITITPSDVVTLVVTLNTGGANSMSGDKNLTVPDGGSAVALLGVALAGIESVRRLLRTRKA